MKKFSITSSVTISMYTDVEAETEEEAIKIAENRDPIRLCHQCGNDLSASEEWVTSGELDGIPTDLRVEEM